MGWQIHKVGKWYNVWSTVACGYLMDSPNTAGGVVKLFLDRAERQTLDLVTDELLRVKPRDEWASEDE